MIVAISSLESPDHAINKEPNVMNILWNIGKRCNYNCSYCSPDIHDSTSPHINYLNSLKFIDTVIEFTKTKNKKCHFSITGGEPFVNPNMIDILKYIKSKNVYQNIVISNGSMPVDVYKEACKYITNLTISLHFERSISEIQNTISKIIQLKNEPVMLNINVMMLPKTFEYIKTVINTLTGHKINYVIRKIETRSFDIQNYYTEEELIFLIENQTKMWNNTKLYYENYEREINSDELISNNLNEFKHWKCYGGIDLIFVNYNGDVYRSFCKQDKIGHIDNLDLNLEPTICKRTYCLCNADIPIRKCIQGYEHKIQN